MTTERTTQGLIEAQFELVDEVLENKDRKVEDRVAMVSKLVNGIRGVAALNLAHQREVAKGLTNASQPLRLVNGSSESDEN